MESLLALWTEVAQESGPALSDLVLSEALESGETHRIWDSSSDESHKAVLSFINPMLNEPRTRQKGLMLLTRFVDQLNPSRFVGIQDALVSALHLCVKSLDMNLAQRFLSKVLPHCQKLPELSQTITSGIVPKILSTFCDSSKSSLPSADELELLKICLDKFHGPCGNQRMNLEKIIVSFIDRSDVSETEMKLIGQALPLLSAAGGGGTNGEKHSQDWSQMVTRILRSMYDCLAQLYGDASPMFESENPYETEIPKLGLPEFRERNVFLRITLIKIRLLNLSSFLSHYLKDPFPAPKPVPLKSILTLIRQMMTLNPVDLLKSFATPPKEYLFLSIVLPSIHQAGFKLLGCLIHSVKGNILTEAVLYEQLTLHEFKWMSERPNAFVELKLEIYKTILIWMSVSKNSIASTKTACSWAQQIRKDISIDKDTIELNLAVRSKGNKKGVFKASTKTQFISASLNSSGLSNIKYKNSTVCSMALELLSFIIPSLDSASHKLIYQLLGRTVTELSESPTFLSPYDHPNCRRRIYECVESLARYPNPFSPISLSFTMNLIGKGGLDDSVASISHKASSLLERIIHPICPSFSFPNISTALTSDVPPAVESENVAEEPEIMEVQTNESFCQTEDTGPGQADQSLGNASMITQFDMNEFQDSIALNIESTIRKVLSRNPTIGLHARTDVFDSQELDISLPDPTTFARSSPIPMPQSLVIPDANGFGKRKDEFSPSPLNRAEQVSVKRLKGNDMNEEHDFDVVNMLKDFVADDPEN